MNKIITTHNGVFHADEVFGVACLWLLFEGKCEIKRSHRGAFDPQSDFIIDIGMKYDGEKYFDHHQRDFTLCRENGVKYSSFGLIWLKFGKELCGGNQEIADIVDSMLVESIDAHDNGQSKPTKEVTISGIISGFNPQWFEEVDQEEEDQRFKQALIVAVKVINDFIRKAKGLVMAKEVVYNGDLILDDKVLIISKFAPWQSQVINEFPNVLFIIFPDKTGGWKIQAVPEKGKEKKNKKDLPKHWGGLSCQTLEEVSGVEDIVFCHAGLFIAGANTYEAIFKMAELAVNYNSSDEGELV